MIDFDYSDFTITVLAAEIEEEVVRVKNLEAAIDDLPEARERLAALKAEMASRVAPEQPKDTSDEDSTETMVEASHPNMAGGTTTKKVFADGTASIVATDASGASIEMISGEANTSIIDLNPEQQDNYFDGLPHNQTEPDPTYGMGSSEGGGVRVPVTNGQAQE